MKKTEVKAGDVVRLVHYVKVETASNRNLEKSAGCLDLERGYKFDLIGNGLVESVDSADFFDKTEKVSRTKLVEIFENAGDNVFTVKFEKQGGESRTLRGYLVTRETCFGRSNVVDLDLPKGNNPNYDGRLRQVDHRTLEQVVLNGVRYQVKAPARKKK